MAGVKFYIEDIKDTLLSNDDLHYYGAVYKYHYRSVEKSRASSNAIHKHPLYVVLHSSAVEFRFNGKIDSKDNNKNGTDFPDNQILYLDLSKNKYAQEKLNHQLRELFEHRFPISSSEFKINIPEKKDEEDTEIYYTSDEVLNHFPKKKNNADSTSKSKDEKLEDSTSTSENKPLEFRVLLLDFLYEFFEHQNTFEDDPNYNNIKALLGESPFFNAIIAKANYYYQFEYISSKDLTGVKYEPKDLIKSIKLALKKWVELLQEHNAHKTIKPKNNWFKDVETEMRLALNEEEKKLHLLYFNNAKAEVEELREESHHLREHAVSWFIGRNNIFRAWNIGDCFQRILFLLGLGCILILVSVFVVSIFLTIEPNTFKKLSFCLYVIFASPFLIALIFYLFNSCRKKKYLRNKEHQNNKKNIFDKIVKDLKLIIELLKNKKKRSNEINRIFDKVFKVIKEKTKFITLLMLPLWALIFGATHIVFETQSFYNRLFIKNQYTYEFSIYLIVLLLAIVLSKYCLHKEGRQKNIECKENEKLNGKAVFALWHYGLLLFLSLINCFTNYFCNNTFYSLSWSSFILYTLISIILFVVLFNHEKESHPNLDESLSINKTFSMLFYGLVISFFINVFYINTEYKEYLERYEYLGHIWHHTQKEYAFNYNKKNNNYELVDSRKDGEYYGVYKIESKSIKDTLKLYSISESILDTTYFYVYEPDSISYKASKEIFLANLEKINVKKKTLNKLKNDIQSLNKKNVIFDSIKQISDDKIIKLKKDSIDLIKQNLVELNKNLNDFNKKYFKKYKKIKQSIYQPLSDDIEVTIDKVFFEELNNVYLFEQKSDGTYKRSKVAVIKKINLFGIQLITIPNILFINTFLSLFIAVILQIFINKTKFMLGGGGHGH